MNKETKSKKQSYSKRISEKIKEYLKDYLKNIDFDMSYNNSHFVFEVKDVEVRSDILKKFGIPLELTKGKIQEIKVTIQSLTFNKPILIEVSGINVDVRTIYLSRDYKKDFKNFRQKILDEWERNHREFLQNLMKKDNFLEKTIINQLIPLKLEINNVKVVITDTVTSQNHRKIALVIGNITSYGCDQVWEPILQQKEEMEEARRIFNVSKMYVNIYQEKYVREEDSEAISTENCFIQPLDFHVKTLFPVKKNPNLRRIPKLHLEVSIESPLLFDVSISKLKFLISFLNYLSKIKKVEKYWIHRPEMKDDKINATMAKEWFKYAFRVVREEVRNRKRQNQDFTSLIEKVINMERYIQFYKTSHKLIIAPWIRYNDCTEDLQGLENKMTLEDIIYCREIAFTELITEGKAFCASGEIGEGYKPLVHLWEFYVNDLRSKWMNKSDPNAQIELSSEERRDLMMLANLDKDKVILSYLKGEPNHPEDIISSFKINLDIIIFNISRKVKYSYKKFEKFPNEFEVTEQMKFYQGIYSNILFKQLQKSKFVECLSNLTEEDIRAILLDEAKVDIQNDSHVEEDQNNMIVTDLKRDVELVNITDDRRYNRLLMENETLQNININNQNERESINTGIYSDKFFPDVKSRKQGLRVYNTNDDTDSVDYLDEMIELNDVLENNRENQNQIVFNQLQPNRTNTPNYPRELQRKNTQQFFNNSGRQSDVPYININNIPKKETNQFLNVDVNFSNNNNNIIQKSDSKKVRKTILSLVFGQLNVTTKTLRNFAEDINVRIFSLNLIDHNLTYANVNKHNEAASAENSENKNDTLDSAINTDLVRLIFQQIFCDNEYHTFSRLDEKNIDPSYHSHIFLEASFAKFLCELLMIQKNRDAILMKEMSHEKSFINEFIYKFGFREIDANSDFPQIEEFYQKLVITFLLERDLFIDKLQLIEKLIKQTKMNYLLHEKYNIFNRKFIAKVFEKALHKNIFNNQNAVTGKFAMEENELSYSNSRIKVTKNPIFASSNNPHRLTVFSKTQLNSNNNNIQEMNEERQKDEKIRNLMIADMNFVMEEICVNLMKYVFSSTYPYFMHERGIQVVYKKNLKIYCDKISERLREENKKSTTINMQSFIPETDFFLIMRKTKQGRVYPHYIYKENDSIDVVNVDKKGTVKKSSSNIKEEKVEEKFVLTENSVPIPTNTESSLSVKMKKEINLDISNETVAEMLCVIPYLTKSNSKELIFAGNILTDLKKSYLDIYENLRQMKAKWKVIEYLKELKEKKGGGNSNSSEMNYILSKIKHLEEIVKSKTSINLSLNTLNLKIIDKLFFITYEKLFSLTLKFNKLEITNSKMEKLPILIEENMNNLNKANEINLKKSSTIKENFVKNSKLFDFDLILKMFYETNIEIQKIFLMIDDHYPLLETNLKIKLTSSMIPNVPFAPNEIIDMNSSSIKVNVTPSIQKVNYIFSNMKYFQDLYGKKFEIISNNENDFDLDKNNILDKNNTSSIILHFHQKLQKNLMKILENKKRYKDFISYLKNRNNTVFFYSIGKYNPRVSDEVNYGQGIFIEFKEFDSVLNSDDILTTTNKQNQKGVILFSNEKSNHNEKSSKSSTKDQGNIFTLHIPILILNKRDTMFYEEKQVWLSDVFTYKINNNPNLNFEKLKIKFDSDEKFNFTSFEFLFCKLFLDTTDYLIHNSEEIHSLKDVEFNSRDFPFDFKFSTPSKLKLNNLISQKSFYYEQEENLRINIYSKFFKKKSGGFNYNMSKGEILSYLKVSIEKISFQIFAKNNSQILNFYNNLKVFANLDEDFKQNKFEIVEKEADFIQNANVKAPNKTAKEKYNGSKRLEERTVSKISMHRIFIHVKDVKLKAFYGIKNSHDNLMAFFVVNNICYQENMNILMHNMYENPKINKIFVKDEEEEVVPIVLSNLFTSSVKLVLSIPSYFRKEDREEERVKVLNEKKMKEIFEKMQKDENKLLALSLGNISMKVIQKERTELEFEVGDVVKIGFAKREGEKVVPENIDSTQIEPLIWIVTNKLLSKVDSFGDDSNLENIMIQSSSDIMQGTDIERNKIKDKLSGIEFNSEFNYSLKLFITPVKYTKQKQSTEDSSTLFFNLLKMLNIIKSLTSMQTDYVLNVNVNVVNVEIPYYTFNYIYFLRNHLREFEALKNQKSKFDESFLEADSAIDVDYDQFVEENIIPTISFVKDRKESFANKKLNTLTQFNLKRISKLTTALVKGNSENPSQQKKELKDKQYNMIQFHIPYLSICLKQKSERNQDIIFFDFSLIKIRGDVLINLQDRTKDVFNLKVNNLKWKPYESRYTNLLIKHETNKSEVFELEIKLGKPQPNAIEEIRNKLLIAKEDPDEQISMVGRLKQFTMVMVNKSIKELVLFFEQNTECLRENPMKEHFKLLDLTLKEEKTNFKLYISEGNLLLPETSQSANAILLNFREGSMTFKKSNEVPKLLVEPKDKFLLIDKKAAFNLKSFMAEPNEYVPHARIEINAEDVASFFYIDQELQSFFQAKNFGVTIKSPQNESVVMSLRKELWKEKYQGDVVSYKPSVLLNLSQANLNTTMGKLFSIKLFVDGNIDEKSSVLNDTNAKFDNIDFNFNIESGGGRVDVFKIPDSFAKNLEQIINILPGSGNELNSNPLNNITNKNYK